jgi:hypothetical protein
MQPSFIGRKVEKHFDGHGVFAGEVVSVDETLYKVRYEDGDAEELELHELRRLLVPGQAAEEQVEKQRDSPAKDAGPPPARSAVGRPRQLKHWPKEEDEAAEVAEAAGGAASLNGASVHALARVVSAELAGRILFVGDEQAYASWGDLEARVAGLGRGKLAALRRAFTLPEEEAAAEEAEPEDDVEQAEAEEAEAEEAEGDGQRGAMNAATLAEVLAQRPCAACRSGGAPGTRHTFRGLCKNPAGALAAKDQRRREVIVKARRRGGARQGSSSPRHLVSPLEVLW